MATKDDGYFELALPSSDPDLEAKAEAFKNQATKDAKAKGFDKVLFSRREQDDSVLLVALPCRATAPQEGPEPALPMKAVDKLSSGLGGGTASTLTLE